MRFYSPSSQGHHGSPMYAKVLHMLQTWRLESALRSQILAGARLTAMLAWVLGIALLPLTQAWAQTSSTEPVGTASPPAPAGDTTASDEPDALAALAERSDDPVSRFLNDNGLVTPGPVSTLAQQVKGHATQLASELVISAMDFLGVRYKMGGQSRDTGFDCSGFTRHVFERSLGLVLPRRAAEQANMPGLMQINQAELKPGDLVFFNTLRHTFSHVGIYIGDNKFIHSPRSGGAVRVEDMRLAYWQQRFDGARRAPVLSKVSAAGNNRRGDTAP